VFQFDRKGRTESPHELWVGQHLDGPTEGHHQGVSHGAVEGYAAAHEDHLTLLKAACECRHA